MTKQMVDVELEAFSLYDFECSVDDMIETMQRAKAAHGGSAKLELRDRKYDDGQYLAVMGKREETDKEYEDRLASEARTAKFREEHDRREFERLSKKFKKEASS